MLSSFLHCKSLQYKHDEKKILKMLMKDDDDDDGKSSSSLTATLFLFLFFKLANNEKKT